MAQGKKKTCHKKPIKIEQTAQTDLNKPDNTDGLEKTDNTDGQE
jgi:hypothetical protein